MSGLRALAIVLALASTLQASDVFVPPVLKGVKNDGKPFQARPVPFPAPDEQWSLVQSKHFTFISSTEEKKTRAIAQQLETLAVALAHLNPQFKAEAPAKTLVIVFARHREAQPYFNLLLQRDNANVSGVFVAQKSGGSMLMDLGYGARADRTPFHELVHSLIDNSGATPPLWLDEGLAEYFSNADIREGEIHAGGAVEEHVSELRRRNLIPLQPLFNVVRESDTYNLATGQHAFYAESWAVVDWLMRNGGEHQEKFYELLHDVENGASVESALQSRYGKNLADIQHGLEAYGGFGRPLFAINIPVPNVDTGTTTTRLERADILYELGTYLATMDATRGEAERHFRAALESNPRHARSIAGLGGLRAANAEYDEAVKYFDQAVVADPNDASIQLAYAEALMGTQIGLLAEANPPHDEDVTRFRKARALAQRAIALGLTDGRAFGDLGTTYIVESDSDLGPGIAALERARSLAPGRLDYAMHLFATYRRTGDVAKADPLFATLDAARNAQVSYAARSVIMRVELARANALLKDNKLTEAAAVLNDLAAKSEDKDAKADLQRQANEIARVAEQNRQIEIYNRAIGQVNSGDYKAAKKTLSDLLAHASDPGVIADAKRLQKQLARKQ